MASRLEEAEWRADCLKARMDAVAKADAEERDRRSLPPRNSLGLNLSASRTAYSKRLAEEGPDQEQAAEKETPANAAMRKLRVPTRSDDADPCWDGYEQRGTKEKGGATVPNCVAKSDAYNDEKTLALKYGGDFNMTALVKHLHKLGSWGASRSINFEDDGTDPPRLGWDGDGADKIWSATIDGKDILK